MSATPPSTGDVTTARYVVPTIHGEPAAVYRLADAYRDLAGAVEAAHRRAGFVLADLSRGWRGVGRRALDEPAEAFARSATTLVHALRDAAAELDAYGRQLATAQHHHGFSLHKLLAVGAVVAVSAAAIVVTVGAAGVVEAAAATAAVGAATEAAGAATAADLAAAGGIDEALGGVTSLRPLLAFVVPHLVQVEWAVGAMATWDELTSGRLDWRGIAETGAIAFVASGAASAATEASADAGWLSRSPAALRTATPHLIQGATWAGAAGVDDELLEHRFDALDVTESFALAGGGTFARDVLRERGWWPEEPDYRRDALIGLLHRRGLIVDQRIAHELAVLRQPAREIERGAIDLRLHEGPGHTIERHVSKSAGDLLTRVRDSRIPVASTYWDEATAHDAIEQTLAAHRGMVRRWIAAGCPKTLRLRLSVPYDVGFAVNAHGRVTFIRQATVILRRDQAGIVVVTSYPLGRR